MRLNIKVSDKVELQDTKLNIGTNNVNSIECFFNLSEDFNNLTAFAVFTKNDKTYKSEIINNKCLIPQEILQNENTIELGVYGFALEGQKLVKRCSPIPTSIIIKKGSYKEGQESVDASPNSFEYYLTECKKIKESVESSVGGTGTNDYTELSNKPQINNVELAGNKSLEDLGINIPTKTSELTNDSGFLTEHQDISGKVDKVAGKNLSTNDFTTEEKQKLEGIEAGANKYVLPANVVQDSNYVHTDNNFTTEEKNKLSNLENYNDTELRNAVNNKQNTLVSGTNIKTINNESILGEGNITVGGTGTSGITSDSITSIQVVDTLPETEETGVLYLVKESSKPEVVNLYPSQQENSNTQNGCTISYVDKQVTINGTPTPSSTWGWTNHFTMPLEIGKNYALKLTNASGSFDNSGRTSDDVVIKVLLYGYLADNTEVAVINKEFTDTEIYNAKEFLCGDNYTEYYFSVNAKSNVAFDNLVLDISITEV